MSETASTTTTATSHHQNYYSRGDFDKWCLLAAAAHHVAKQAIIKCDLLAAMSHSAHLASKSRLIIDPQCYYSNDTITGFPCFTDTFYADYSSMTGRR